MGGGGGGEGGRERERRALVFLCVHDQQRARLARARARARAQGKGGRARGGPPGWRARSLSSLPLPLASPPYACWHSLPAPGLGQGPARPDPAGRGRGWGRARGRRRRKRGERGAASIGQRGKKGEGAPGVLLSLRQTGRLRPAHAPCPPLQVRGGRTWEVVGPGGGLQGRSPPPLSLPPNKTHPVHGAVATGFSLRACASDAGNLRRQLSGQSVSVRRTGGRARVGLVWACVCGKVAGHRRALTSGGHTFSRVVFLFFSSRH